jgi:hypothetical protein
MPLIQRARAGHAGPIILVGMAAIVIAALILIGFVDFCPEGFVRECVHAWIGKLTGASCECVRQ